MSLKFSAKQNDAVESIRRFLKKDTEISLAQFASDTKVVGSSLTKLDPICPKTKTNKKTKKS